MNDLERIVRTSEILDVHPSSGRSEVIPQEELLRQLSKATESQEVKSLYQNDMKSIIGRALDKYLDWRGQKRKEPDNYTYLNLPEEVGAATITFNNGTVVLVYNSKHRDELLHNGLNRKYTNLHEHAHVRGIMSEYRADESVENAARSVRKSLIPDYIRSVGNRVKGLYRSTIETLSEAFQIENHAKQRQQMQYET